MTSDVKANVSQINPSVLSEGDRDYIQQGKTLGLWTADWKARLAAAGLAYSAHIGTLSAGADVGFITGGGAGTTVDSDQPELIVGVDAGYFLVPLEVHVTCVLDVDANAEYGEILLFADRTQAPPTSASGTPGIVTPNNQLDGGAAFPGRCFGGVTTDITDPVMSEFIGLEYVIAAEFVSNGAATNLTNGIVYSLKMDKVFHAPKALAGPCSLVVCFGGTAAVTGMVNVEFAAVPASWFPAS